MSQVANKHSKPVISDQKIGKLYIVAVPIGNYADMTPRAIETLKMVDFIIVEDTRHSGKLLKHFTITNKMQALHDHNEAIFAPKIIALLEAGQQLALISDAGTPLISDPGYKLVHLAQQHQIQIIPIPGVSALITALSVSGLATDRFCFEGFLSSKKQSRCNQLASYTNEARTMVFYEAPHRLLDTLKDMADIFGVQHIVVVARELTKTFETIKKDKLGELVSWVDNDRNQQKGEIVLLVEGFKHSGSSRGETTLSAQTENILSKLLEELSLKQSVQLTAAISGEKKKKIYQRALELQS
jgi:16S rRNA (cytidine1402-2'-O)-methyltransferase